MCGQTEHREVRAWSRVERSPAKEGLEGKQVKGAGESLFEGEGGACANRAFAKLECSCSWGLENGVRSRAEVDRGWSLKGQGAI